MVVLLALIIVCLRLLLSLLLIILVPPSRDATCLGVLRILTGLGGRAMVTHDSQGFNGDC
jgi:hypothetical protein